MRVWGMECLLCGASSIAPELLVFRTSLLCLLYRCTTVVMFIHRYFGVCLGTVTNCSCTVKLFFLVGVHSALYCCNTVRILRSTSTVGEVKNINKNIHK